MPHPTDLWCTCPVRQDPALRKTHWVLTGELLKPGGYYGVECSSCRVRWYWRAKHLSKKAGR